jgi:hypothetical protein
VEFEDGLFITVVKIKATRHKNLQLKIVKLLKSQAHPAHFLFQAPPAFFQTSRVRCNGQDLAHIIVSK